MTKEKEGKQTLEDFFNKVKEQKREQLYGVALDIGYWEGVKDKCGDEEKLRKELEDENRKIFKAKDGRVIKDERNQKKVDELNNKIDNAGQSKKKIQELLDTQLALESYIEHVAKPNKKTMDNLKKIEEREL